MAPTRKDAHIRKLLSAFSGGWLLLQTTMVASAADVTASQSSASTGSQSSTPQSNSNGAVPLPTGFALDLSSQTASLAAPNTQPVSVLVGGSLVNGTIQGANAATFSPGQMVTPAQYSAIAQVIGAGAQNLVLNTSGSAVGGFINISSASIGSLSNVVVPANVAINSIGFNAATPLNITGTTSLFGGINAVQTAAGLASVLSFGNLSIASTGWLSGSLPANLTGSNLFQSAAMNINVAGALTNAGAITSPGALNLNVAGIVNNSGLISALNNINITSAIGQIVNTGTIASTMANINLSTQIQNDLVINNMGGILTAINGSINIRDSLYAGKAETSIIGGDWLSRELNINGGQGSILADIAGATGIVNSSGLQAHFFSGQNLTLGLVKLDGDPTYASNGDITINGDIQVGENLAILAGGNIKSTSALTKITSQDATGQGHSIFLVAGLTPSPQCTTCYPTLSGSPATSGSFSVYLQGGGAGGNIDLTASPGLVINSGSTGSNRAGGNVTLAAYANGFNTGKIMLPSDSSIVTGGTGNASNGNVNVAAGGSGTSIQLGNIVMDGGTGGGGALFAATTQPTTQYYNYPWWYGSYYWTVPFDANGNNSNGMIIQPHPSAGAAGAIVVGNITAPANGSIHLKGTDVSITSIIAPSTSVFIESTSSNAFSVGAGSKSNGITGVLSVSAVGTSSGGSIDIRNYGSGGIALADGSVLSSNGPSSGGNGGTIYLNYYGNSGAPLSFGNSSITVDGTGTAGSAGNIYVSAGVFSGTGNLSLSANGAGSGSGGNIYIASRSSQSGLQIGNGSGQVSLSANSGPTGAGGTVDIQSGLDLVVNFGALSRTAQTTYGGSLSLRAGTMGQGELLLSGTKSLDMNTIGSGAGGGLHLYQNSKNALLISKSLSSNGSGGAVGGIIDLGNYGSGGVLIADGVDLNANGSGNASGGQIYINPGIGTPVYMGGSVHADASALGNGAGGYVLLSASSITSANNIYLSANGGASGSGGTVAVQAYNSGLTVGKNSNELTIAAHGGNTTGNGGTVVIRSAQDLVVDSAYVDAHAHGSDGWGGLILLEAGNSGIGSLLISGNLDQTAHGNAWGGQIDLIAHSALALTVDGKLDVSASSGGYGAGSITVNNYGTGGITLSPNASILARVDSTNYSGGYIELDRSSRTGQLTVSDGAIIDASAVNAGAGGHVEIISSTYTGSTLSLKVSGAGSGSGGYASVYFAKAGLSTGTSSGQVFIDARSGKSGGAPGQISLLAGGDITADSSALLQSGVSGTGAYLTISAGEGTGNGALTLQGTFNADGKAGGNGGTLFFAAASSTPLVINQSLSADGSSSGGSGGYISIYNRGSGGVSLADNISLTARGSSNGGNGGSIFLNDAGSGPLSLGKITIDAGTQATTGSWNAGTVIVHGTTITSTDHVTLQANGFGSGDGGYVSVRIDSGDLAITNGTNAISISALPGKAGGYSGNVQVRAGGNLTVDSGFLLRELQGGGSGSLLLLQAGASGSGALSLTGDFSSSGISGTAGEIDLFSNSTTPLVINQKLSVDGGGGGATGGVLQIANGKGGITLGASAQLLARGSSLTGNGGSVNLGSNGAFVINGGLIDVSGRGSSSASAGGVTISAAGVAGTANLSVTASGTGSGQGGFISITNSSGDLKIGSGAGQFSIAATGGTSGNSGSVELHAAGNLSVDVSSLQTAGHNSGRRLFFEAGTAGEGTVTFNSDLINDGVTGGNGGEIDVFVHSSNTLVLNKISSNSGASGYSGGIIRITNYGIGGIEFGQSSAVTSTGTGTGGAIYIGDYSPFSPIIVNGGSIDVSGQTSTNGSGGLIVVQGRSFSGTANLALAANGAGGGGAGTINVNSVAGGDITIGSGPGSISISAVSGATGSGGGHSSINAAGNLNVDMNKLTLGQSTGNGGTLTLTGAQVQISGDIRLDGINGGSGGRINIFANSATPLILNSKLTVNGSSSGGQGGYIDVRNYGPGGIALNNVTTATSVNGAGGNIYMGYNSNYGVLLLNHSINASGASTGGGIHIAGASLQLDSSANVVLNANGASGGLIDLSFGLMSSPITIGSSKGQLALSAKGTADGASSGTIRIFAGQDLIVDVSSALLNMQNGKQFGGEFLLQAGTGGSGSLILSNAINLSGGTNGNGGRIVLHSNATVPFNIGQSLIADGGTNSGAGGYIEIQNSGTGGIVIADGSSISARGSAAGGSGGSIFINTNGGYVDARLSSAILDVSARGSGNRGSGGITLQATSFSSMANLALVANAVGTADGGTVRVTLGGDISVGSGANQLSVSNTNGGTGGTPGYTSITAGGNLNVAVSSISSTAIGTTGRGRTLELIAQNGLVTVDSDISVDGRGAGDGGFVNLVSNSASVMYVNHNFTANGGSGGGNAGFVRIHNDGTGGIVLGSGTVVSSNGTGSSGSGGPLEVYTSGTITNLGAKITADGAGSGGGGTLTLYAATLTGSANYMLSANGGLSGNAGNVFVYSTSGPITVGLGAGEVQIAALGGVSAGNGGVVRVLAGSDLNVSTSALFLGPRNSSGWGGYVELIAGYAGAPGALVITGGKLSVAGAGSGDGGYIGLISRSAAPLSINVDLTANGGANSGSGGFIYLRNDMNGGISFSANLSVTAAGSLAGGNGGTINLNNDAQTGPLVTNGLTLDVSGRGPGDHNAGNVYVFGSTFQTNAAIKISANATGNQNGGFVQVRTSTGAISVGKGATDIGISAVGGASGGGGNINVLAGGDLNVDSAGLVFSPVADGYGGIVNLQAGATGLSGQLTLLSDISLDGKGTGYGGALTLSSNSASPLELNFALTSRGGASGGHGGSVIISNSGYGGIAISAAANVSAVGAGQGGLIRIETSGKIYNGASVIDASATASGGSGGQIYLLSAGIQTTTHLSLRAEGNLNGAGGYINIDTSRSSTANLKLGAGSDAISISAHSGGLSGSAGRVDVIAGANLEVDLGFVDRSGISGYGGGLRLQAGANGDGILQLSGGSLIADAINAGDGGYIVLTQRSSTAFLVPGNISARGGQLGGSGGYIELRNWGTGGIDLPTVLDASSVAGGWGGGIYISTPGKVTHSSGLLLDVSSPTNGGGSVTLIAGTLEGSGKTTIKADGDIYAGNVDIETVSALSIDNSSNGITISARGSRNGPSIVLRAGADLFVDMGAITRAAIVSDYSGQIIFDAGRAGTGLLTLQGDVRLQGRYGANIELSSNSSSSFVLNSAVSSVSQRSSSSPWYGSHPGTISISNAGSGGIVFSSNASVTSIGDNTGGSILLNSGVNTPGALILNGGSITNRATYGGYVEITASRIVTNSNFQVSADSTSCCAGSISITTTDGSSPLNIGVGGPSLALSASSPGNAGSVVVRAAADLNVNTSSIQLIGFGDWSGTLDLEAGVAGTGLLSVQGDVRLDTQRNGGNITLVSNSNQPMALSGIISANGNNGGSGGTIQIRNLGAGGLDFQTGMIVQARSSSQNGYGGLIAINEGVEHPGNVTLSNAVLASDGVINGGTVKLYANSLIVQNHSTLSADGTNSGGGSILLEVTGSTPLQIDTSGNTIALSAKGGFGGGGDISVSAGGDLQVNLAATPFAGTYGRGGDLSLTAGIAGSGNLSINGSINSVGRGDRGGVISLTTNSIEAFVVNQSVAVAGLTGTVKADGDNGGSVTIVNVGSGGISIAGNAAVTAKATASAGRGGTFIASSGGDLAIDVSSFDVSTLSGDGGIVRLTAGTAGPGNLTISSSIIVNGAFAGGGGTIELNSNSSSPFLIGAAPGTINGISGILQAKGGPQGSQSGYIKVTNKGGGLVLGASGQLQAGLDDLSNAGSGPTYILNAAGNLVLPTGSWDVSARGSGGFNGGVLSLVGSTVTIPDSFQLRANGASSGSGGSIELSILSPATVLTTGIGAGQVTATAKGGSNYGYGGNITLRSGGDLFITPSDLSISPSPNGGYVGSYVFQAGTDGVGVLQINGDLKTNSTNSWNAGSVTLLYSADSSNAFVIGAGKVTANGVNGNVTADELYIRNTFSGATVDVFGDFSAPNWEGRLSVSSPGNPAVVTFHHAVNTFIAGEASSFTLNYAPGSQIRLAELKATAGDITVNGASSEVRPTWSTIYVDGGALVLNSGTVNLNYGGIRVRHSDNTGGNLRIQSAGSLDLLGPLDWLDMRSGYNQNAGSLDVLADGPLTLSYGCICLSAYGPASRGGAVSINAASLASQSPNSFAVDVSGEGPGGSISIKLTDSKSNLSVGQSPGFGNLFLAADGYGSVANAGTISVEVGGDLSVAGASLSAIRGSTSGDGASLSFVAGTGAYGGTLSLQGTLNVNGAGKGDAGSILLQSNSTGALTPGLLLASAINGKAGSITIINNGSGGISTVGSLAAESLSGAGGTVRLISANASSLVTVGNIAVNGNGGNFSGGTIEVTAGTLSPVSFSADGAGSGDGGHIAIAITSGAATVSSSTILASARSGPNGGNGGTVQISTAGSLTYLGGISQNPRGSDGNGGQISLSAGTSGSGSLQLDAALSVLPVGKGTSGKIALSAADDLKIDAPISAVDIELGTTNGTIMQISSAVISAATLTVGTQSSSAYANLTNAVNSIAMLSGSGSGSIQLNNGTTDLRLGSFGTGQSLDVVAAGAIKTSFDNNTFSSLSLTGTGIQLLHVETAGKTATLSAGLGGITINAQQTFNGTNNQLISQGGDITETGAGSITAQTLTVDLQPTGGATPIIGSAKLTGANKIGLLNGAGKGSIVLNNGTTDLQLGTFAQGQTLQVDSAGKVSTAADGNNFASLWVTASQVYLGNDVKVSGKATLNATDSITSGGKSLLTGTSILLDSVGGGIDVKTSTNDLTLTASGAIIDTNLSTSSLSLTGNAKGGDFVLNNNMGISANDITAKGAVSLTAGTGDITSAAKTSVGGSSIQLHAQSGSINVTTTSNDLTFIALDSVSDTNTSSSALTLQGSATGGDFIVENNLTINASDISAKAELSLTAVTGEINSATKTALRGGSVGLSAKSGSIDVTSATNDLTAVASGAVSDTNTSTTSLALTGSAKGGDFILGNNLGIIARDVTAKGSLSLTAGAGDISSAAKTSLGGGTVQLNALGGSVDVTTTTNDLTLVAASTVSDTNSSSSLLALKGSAKGGDFVVGNNIGINAGDIGANGRLSLTSNAGDITSGTKTSLSGGSIWLNAQAGGINVTTTTNDLTLICDTTVSDTNTSTTNLVLNGSAHGGDFLLANNVGITAYDVAAKDSLSLTAKSGDITSTAKTSLGGGSVQLNAQGGSLNVITSSHNLTMTASGGVNVSNTSATIASIKGSAETGDFILSNNRSIEVGTVDSGGAIIKISTTSGDITFTGKVSSNGHLTVAAAGGITILPSGTLTGPGAKSLVALTGSIDIEGAVTANGAVPGRIDLVSDTVILNAPVESVGSGATGGVIYFSAVNESLKVTSNSSIIATNANEDKGIVAFAQGAKGTLTVNGTGTIKAADYVGFGKIDPVTLAVADAGPPVPGSSFTAPGITVTQQSLGSKTLATGYVPPSSPSQSVSAQSSSSNPASDSNNNLSLGTFTSPTDPSFIPRVPVDTVRGEQVSGSTNSTGALLFGSVEDQENIIDVLLYDGTQLFPSSTGLSPVGNRSIPAIGKGNFLIVPENESSFEVPSGILTVPANSAVLVIVNGQGESAIFNLHDDWAPPVVNIDGRTISIPIGTQVVWGRNMEVDKQTAGASIPSRGITKAADASKGISIYTADFSISSTFSRVPKLKGMFDSKSKRHRALAKKIMINAAIMQQLMARKGPYKMSMR